MPTIAVIDYDAGNLHSACKGLEAAGGTAQVTDSAQELMAADGILLPGVGAWDPTVQNIRDRHLEDPIKQAIAAGKPFLGICMGLQVLFEASDEGNDPGLGVVPGRVRKFQPEPTITIPHMGWNRLHLQQPDFPLWEQIPEASWMYFVHSYYVDPEDAQVQAATITHGSQTVTAAIVQGNLMAVQFHPEKSSTAGMQLLANFVKLVSDRNA
ncbi:MAG: imidazole glycerol phosphate synthase subunit HisH [Synechococcales bacterium]|nr:imidazole glycerol phosphate synthase subunit HisH [Synechococcales bacterium]